MIRTVSKDYYYSKTTGKDYTKKELSEYPLKNITRGRYNITKLYLEYDGSVFVYIAFLDSVLIPGDQKLDPSEVDSGMFKISDGWELEFITPEIPKDYTLSKFTFNEGGIFVDARSPINETKSGKYVLKCINGDEIEFYVKYEKTEYSGNSYMYVSFPERLEFPMDLRKIREKISLIETILDDKFGEEPKDMKWA